MMMVVGIHGFCSWISGLPLSVLTLQASCLLLSGFPGPVMGVSSWGQLTHIHKEQHRVPSPGKGRTLSTPEAGWGELAPQKEVDLGPIWPPPFVCTSCEEFVSDQVYSCMVCWSRDCCGRLARKPLGRDHLSDLKVVPLLWDCLKVVFTNHWIDWSCHLPLMTWSSLASWVFIEKPLLRACHVQALC